MAANEKYLTQSETPFIKGEGDNSAKLKPNPYIPDETFNLATGDQSVAEGQSRYATGHYSHAEGIGTDAFDYDESRTSYYNFNIRKLTVNEISTVNNAYMDEHSKFSGDNVYVVSDAWSDFNGYMFTQTEGGYPYAYVVRRVEDMNTLIEWYSAIVQTNVPLRAEGGGNVGTARTTVWAAKIIDGAIGDYSHAEGNGTTASGTGSHAEGYSTKANGYGSHAEGTYTKANGYGSHAEGNNTQATDTGAHAEGNSTKATSGAHAEGSGTQATNTGAHAEGLATTASGWLSHAEGGGTVAGQNCSHAEGSGTTATKTAAHSEGKFTGADGEGAHSGGVGLSASSKVLASGSGSFAHGYKVGNNAFEATGNYGSIAMGTSNSGPLQAKGAYGAVAMGDGAIASGQTSIALGKGVVAQRNGSAAFGEFNKYDSLTQFSYGNGTAIGNRRNLIELRNDKFYVKGIGGYDGTNADTSTTSSLTDAIMFVPGSGEYSAVQNVDNVRYAGDYAVAEGAARAYGNYSHAEGQSIDSYEYVGSYYVRKLTEDEIDNFNDRYSTTFSGTVYLAEDANTDFYENNWVVYDNGVAEELIAFIPKSAIDWVGVTGNWYGTVFTTTAPISAVTSTTTTVSVDFAQILYGALGSYSHAEGRNTKASGQYSHAEGYYTTASGQYSHAEGSYARAYANYSHAEGFHANAQTLFTHAEGRETYANGNGAHAEGYGTRALGEYSHTEGYFTKTSSNRAEHAEGSYNATNRTNGSFGNSGNTIHSVGIGTGDNYRMNAFEIMQNGDAYLYGVGGYNGANATASTSTSLQTAITTRKYACTRTAGSGVNSLYCVNGHIICYSGGTSSDFSGTFIMSLTEFYEKYMRSIGAYNNIRAASMTAAQKVNELSELMMDSSITKLKTASSRTKSTFVYFSTSGSAVDMITSFTYGASVSGNRIAVSTGQVTVTIVSG